MSTRGGKRPNSGRPVGATTRPKISDFISDEDFKKILDKARELALAGNEGMIKFIAEQRLGKAVQPIGNDGTEPFRVVGVEITIRK